eukprot:2578999-Heterocapsa_arctica.AAC.1
MREDLRLAYEELEEIGWTQVISDAKEDGEESANSEEVPGFMPAIAAGERRQMRARETSEERRQRRARNR